MQGVPNCLNCKFYNPPDPVTEDFDQKKAYLNIGKCAHPQCKRIWFRRCFSGKYACDYWHIADGLIDDDMVEMIKSMSLRIDQIAQHLGIEFEEHKDESDKA